MNKYVILLCFYLPLTLSGQSHDPCTFNNVIIKKETMDTHIKQIMDEYVQETTNLFWGYGKLQRIASMMYILHNNSSYSHNILNLINIGATILGGASLFAISTNPMISLGSFLMLQSFSSMSNLENLRRCTKNCITTFSKTEAEKFHTLRHIKDYNSFILEYQGVDKDSHWTVQQIESLVKQIQDGKNQGMKCLTTCAIGRLEDAATSIREKNRASYHYTCEFINHLPKDHMIKNMLRLGQVLALSHKIVNITGILENSRLEKFLQKSNNGKNCFEHLPEKFDEKMCILTQFMDAMKKETPGLLTHLRKKQESMNNYTDLGLLVQYIQNNTLTEENIKNHIHVINSHTQLGRKTPLHVATEENKDLFVEILIKNGADVNIPDSHDNTPLHIAAQKNEPKIVKLLLKARANSNEKNKDGKTPLDLTKDNTIKSLLEANRLLIAAVKEGIPTSVDAMLEKGANLDIRDENDNNLLMIAARNNQVNMIDFLITQKKIDVNTLKETNGNTALHIAAAKGDIEFVTALLKHGANAYISNEDGKTALDVVTDRLNNPKNHDPEKVSKLSKIIHILSHKND